MKLFLQSSSGAPALVLWQDGVVFEANYGRMQRLNYASALAAALQSTGRALAEIDGVIVDTGPGRLGATRTAVAFANGLAYARQVPIFALNSFIMLGAYAETTHNKPCLVLRSAARQQYHWGLVQGGRVVEAGFAPDAVITPAYRGAVTVAGDATPERARIKGPNPEWLSLNAVPGAALSMWAPFLHPAKGPVVPLTDTAGLADG